MESEPLFYVAALRVGCAAFLLYSGDIGDAPMFTRDTDLAKLFNEEEDAEAFCLENRRMFEDGPAELVAVPYPPSL
jgi:hypothetical protein